MSTRNYVAVVLVLSLALTGCRKESEKKLADDEASRPIDVDSRPAQPMIATVPKQQCTVILRAGTLPEIIQNGRDRVVNNEGSKTIKGTLLSRNNDWVEIDTATARYSIPVDRIAYIQFPKAHDHGNHDHGHGHPSDTKGAVEGDAPGKGGDDSAPGSASKGDTIERNKTKRTLRKPNVFDDTVEGDFAPGSGRDGSTPDGVEDAG